MPWEFSAIKMLWKQSHYLTYQQVHSWSHGDVSSVSHTWQDTAEWLKPKVVVIKRHFQKWRISLFLKIYLFFYRVHPPFTFSEALYVLKLEAWKMGWAAACRMAMLLVSGRWCSSSLKNSVHLWEIVVCFKDKTMGIYFASGSAGGVCVWRKVWTYNAESFSDPSGMQACTHCPCSELASALMGSLAVQWCGHVRAE